MTKLCTFKPIVVLPTFNERHNIQQIIPAILDVSPIDILIVDDNSPDGTGALAQNLARTNKHVRVLHRTDKAGIRQMVAKHCKKNERSLTCSHV